MEAGQGESKRGKETRRMCGIWAFYLEWTLRDSTETRGVEVTWKSSGSGIEVPRHLANLYAAYTYACICNPALAFSVDKTIASALHTIAKVSLICLTVSSMFYKV